jgi:urea carboxylase
VRAEDGEFRLAGYRAFLAENAASLEEFRAKQAEAFSAERSSWRSTGELTDSGQKLP